MIWTILAGVAGVSVHVLMKLANASRKKDFSLKQFFKMNGIQYTASLAATIVAILTTPGVGWALALGIGYAGGSVAKNLGKGIEGQMK